MTFKRPCRRRAWRCDAATRCSSAPAGASDFGKDNATYLGDRSPGPGIDAARWMIDRGVRLAADDTATFEKRPAAYGKEPCSVHMMLLVDRGIYIVENANLEPLSDANVWVAMLVMTPLKIQGASGSPLRAVAIA